MSNLDFWRGRNLSPWTNDWNSAMDKMLSDFDKWPTMRAANKELAKWNPSVEVNETKTHFNLRFDVPGLTKDQIKLELNDNRLTVSGERREERKEDDKEKKTHYSEVFYGSFLRSFDFPTPVNAEKVEAKYDNGVLSVAVQKEVPTAARTISIK